MVYPCYSCHTPINENSQQCCTNARMYINILRTIIADRSEYLTKGVSHDNPHLTDELID